MAGAIGLGVVALVMLGVLVAPQAAWNAAAEHSKRFWSVWALAFVTIGLAPALVMGEVPVGWALIWLLVCCAGAVLQPAMWTDLRETRRWRARSRHASPVPAPRPSPMPARVVSPSSEIKWYAPIRYDAPPDHTRPAQTRPDQIWMGTSA